MFATKPAQVFVCPICGKTFSQLKKLIKHAREEHLDGTRCPICNKVFNNTRALAMHCSRLGQRDPKHALLHLALTRATGRYKSRQVARRTLRVNGFIRTAH